MPDKLPRKHSSMNSPGKRIYDNEPYATITLDFIRTINDLPIDILELVQEVLELRISCKYSEAQRIVEEAGRNLDLEHKPTLKEIYQAVEDKYERVRWWTNATAREAIFQLLRQKDKWAAADCVILPAPPDDECGTIVLYEGADYTKLVDKYGFKEE